jgi:hypothetical protein
MADVQAFVARRSGPSPAISDTRSTTARLGPSGAVGNIAAMSDADVRIPRAMRTAAQPIIDITDDVCQVHLDEEYAQIARQLVARLARKRPSPLVRGDARIWAGGVLYVAAQANFLFDRSQTPHLTAKELAEAIGVKQPTMANKAALINRLLDVGVFEPELMRVAMLEQHPLAWMVEVNGFLVDARTLPLGVQELARQQGLIPDLDARRAA